MSFNDMVKSIRKGRRPSKIRIGDKEYPIDKRGWVGIELENGMWMQYQMCYNLNEFWDNYEDNKDDPDALTHVFYKDGSMWCSDDDVPPKKSGVDSALISAGWGFVCYNCKPIVIEDEYGDLIYDVEMN